MISRDCQWTWTPLTTCLQPKNEMLIFWLCSTSDDWPGWSMDSNPIHHPSPAKKMKCSFLDFVQLLMICWAGWWTQTPSATPLQPKEWNAHFWIMFNFWWLARLVNGLKPHLSPPLSSQWKWNAKKWNPHFCIMFNFWCWPDWSMDSNPIHHPSPANKMKCFIFGLCSLLMISQAGWWTWTPSTTCLQPKKWNAHFCITFNFWCWPDWSLDSNPIHHPSPAKKMKCFFFGLCSTSDDWPGWVMDSNPIHHPSPAKKMKCSFLDYIQLLMIGRAGQWTQTPSTTPLQPKKWNACFWILFTSDDCQADYELEPHLPPLSSQKNEMIFVLHSTSDDQPAGWWTQTPSTTPLQPIKWNAHFWITFNFWWSAGLVDGLEPHPPPASSQKMKCSYFDYVQLLMIGRAGQWTEPHLPPLSTKKMKCSFLYYIQLLMLSQTGQWTQTPSTTPLQPKKWNAHFWIMFNFWWSARLVDGLKPHPPPALQPKKWNAHFWIYVQLLMTGRAGRWTQTPSTTPLQPKKWNASFLDYVHFWWSARLVDGLKPHLPPLSSQKNEMLIFVLHSTSDDQSMDWSPPKKWNAHILIKLLMIGQVGHGLNPIHHLLQPKKWNAHFWILFNFWWSAGLVDGLKPHPPPSPAYKMKCSYFDYVQLLMIGCSMKSNPICHPSPANKMKCSLERSTSDPRALNLIHQSPKNEMLIFDYVQLLMLAMDWSMDSNPIHHPSPANKMKCFFLDYVHFWWSARLVDGLKPHLPPLSSQRDEMLIFVLCSTSNDQLGWSMDSNPSTTPLQPKQWNAHFCITFNIWCWPDWSMDLNLIHHPSPAKKMKCSYFDYVQLLMMTQPGCSMFNSEPHQTPCHPSPANKMKCFFLDYVHFWWSARLVDGLKPHLPPLSSQRNEMLIFVLCSTSDDQLGWSMDSNPIHHPSPAKKWNAHFCITFNIWCWPDWSMDLNLIHHPPPANKMKCSFLDYN